MRKSIKPFELNGTQFGFLDPYIIAEIGVNHEGDLDRAKRMIEAAARGGAQAAKFQTFKADLLAAKQSSPSYWDRSKEPTSSQHELFSRWDKFDEAEYRALASTCNECGVDFLSTPFDLKAVELVSELAPAIKIASADVTNIPLLRKVGLHRKPVIMSTGASRLFEVDSAIDELIASGCENVTLLHCVLNYPTLLENAQLAMIKQLQRVFGTEHAIGYSDHVKPDDCGRMPALEMAALFGSVVIEKHFTDEKSGTGNDHYHAMDEHDLKAFVHCIDRFRELHGTSTKQLELEKAAINNARRRILASQDMRTGQIVGADNVVALRSNQGIEVSHWDEVVGRELSFDVGNGTPLEWKHLK